MDGFRRSDHEAILALLTDDVVWRIHGLRTTRGKAEFDSQIENPAFAGSPALDVERTIEADDVVILAGIGQGHHREAGSLRFTAPPRTSTHQGEDGLGRAGLGVHPRVESADPPPTSRSRFVRWPRRAGSTRFSRPVKIWSTAANWAVRLKGSRTFPG